MRADIQGLRGFSVLAVMSYHYNPALAPGGYIGVDVFFVISGFLLTALLLEKENTGGLSYKLFFDFYAARVRRIAPAYFVMLILVTLAASILFVPADFVLFLESYDSAWLFRSNQFFSNYGSYFAPDSHEQPLMHTWSLAVEVQFYLLIPFLMLVPPRQFLPVILGLLLIFFALLTERGPSVSDQESAAYFSLSARVPEFIAGSLAALYLTSKNFGKGLSRLLRNVGITVLLVSLFLQPVLGGSPGLPILIPVLGTVAILLGVRSPSRILESRILVAIGGLSYSIYLWHWPVLAFLRYVSGSEVLGMANSCLFLLITSLLSIASFNLVEEPSRRSLSSRGRASAYLLVVAATCISPSAFATVNKWLSPPLLPIEYRRYADPATICHGKIVGNCERGWSLAEDYILVLGDSHGAMLNGFFDELGGSLKFKAIVITASNCVTIPGLERSGVDKKQALCNNQISLASKLLPEASGVVVAGSWSGAIRRQRFLVTLERFLRDQSEKPIFLMPQVPRFKVNTLRARRLNALGLSTSAQVDEIYRTANDEIRTLVSRYDNAHFVALEDLDIFNDAPFWKGRPIYFDKHHLNEVGSLLYATAAEAVFDSDVIRRLP